MQLTLLIIVNVQDHTDATVGNYFIYVDKSDKVDIHIGSGRSSYLKVKDTSIGKIRLYSI